MRASGTAERKSASSREVAAGVGNNENVVGAPMFAMRDRRFMAISRVIER
jgi:hypothetical protein